MQRPTFQLSIDFTARARHGTVTVSFAPNDDPVGVGCDARAAGFPVCQAVVSYDGHGYDAVLGWVQLVGVATTIGGGRQFELDPLQIYDGLETPFAFHGLRPTLFDAPWRRDRDQRLDWLAHSFLCVAPAGPMAREAMPVVAFSWGFTLDHGSITLVEPAALDAGSWRTHRALLTSTYPSWTFLDPTDPPAA